MSLVQDRQSAPYCINFYFLRKEVPQYNNKRGSFPVPFVRGIILVKRDILEKNPNIFVKNGFIDIKRRFCYNLNQNGIQPYINNIKYCGEIID